MCTSFLQEESDNLETDYKEMAGEVFISSWVASSMLNYKTDS